MELLCPAGNMDAFIAAVNHGADAIYLAGKSFGARGYAKNFSNEELEEVIKLGKLYGVKVYITMNTLVKDSEVDEFLKQVEFLYHHGVDAIIMQDFGMMCFVRQKYPNLEIHASTQFNSSNIKTIELLHQMGIKRVVLPREMSIDEIKKIDIPIEKEVFIHGALCVSYSGCCLFSQRLGGRSGNRGVCAGSCRLPYQLYLNHEKIKEGYLLSMKELKIADSVYELEGYVDSLKIEGRMKSPSYVAFITSYYKDILCGKKISLKREEDLQSLFYREFTKGHLFQEKNLTNIKSPNHIGLKIGKVIRVSEDRITILLSKTLEQGDGIRFVNSKKGMIVNFIYDDQDRLIRSGKSGQVIEIDNKVKLQEVDEVSKTTNISLEIKENVITKKVPIDIKVTAIIGQPLEIVFCDEAGHEVYYLGEKVEKAKNMPVTKERIKEQIIKLGNSPFIVNKFTIVSEDDIFIRIGDLNIARRTLTERLTGVRLNDYKEPIICDVSFNRVSTCQKVTMDRYVDYPRNTFDIPSLEKGKYAISEIMNVKDYDCIGTYHLNVYNSYTAYYLYQLGYRAITLSVELNEEEFIQLISCVRDKFGDIPLCIKTKGFVEVMIIKENILGIDKNITYELVDKLNHHFPVYYDGRMTHVLSHEAISLNTNLLPKDVICEN